MKIRITSQKDATLVVDSIVEITRDLAPRHPAPRGAPYFGLDMPVTDLTALDVLCREGIFRKYQRAIVLDCGFGGTARWWSIRFGCRVTGFSEDIAMAAAAHTLGERSGSIGQVTFAAGHPTAIPCRDTSVTHVWGIDLDTPPGPVVREAFRVLRPSSYFGFHASEFWPGSVDAWHDAVVSAGFVAIERRMVPLVEAPASHDAAHGRLLQKLSNGGASEQVLDAFQERFPMRRFAVQIIAQRPSYSALPPANVKG